MGKKRVKPKYTPKADRIARQKREARNARAPLAAWQKIALMVGGGIAALALVLLAIFYHGPNLRVVDGVVQTEGDNWIIADLSQTNAHRYFKLGEANPLPGYAWNPDQTVKYDDNERDYWFEPEDETAEPYYYYVAGVSEDAATYALEARTNFAGMYGEEAVSPVQTATVAGREAHYFTAQSTDANATPVTVSQAMTCYFPAVRGACILVTFAYHVTEETPARSEAEMLAMLETIMPTIAFEEAD